MFWAGQRGQTTDTREFRGIASGAYLVNLRVLGDDGAGMASDVIEAIDWSIEHKADYDIKVINMSIGEATESSTRMAETDAAVRYAVAHGVVLVASAGNGAETSNQTEYPAAYHQDVRPSRDHA